MASLALGTGKKNDDYNTPKYAWEWIKDYIPKNKIIYEPFWNADSQSGQYLREITGNEVIFEDIDFWTHRERNLKYDLIISNIPFSNKSAILDALYAFDKPFIIIVPVSTISKQYFFKWLRKAGTENVSILVPPKRIHFDNKECKDKGKSSCWFDVIYLCYKMDLQREINYIALND